METTLYPPIKRFLEKLGFTVKGEIGGCDLVALSGDDPPVVVVGELKLAFNLELILQAVDRAGAADEIWIAAKVSARGKGRESDARYRNLCRRLGFGMLGVTLFGLVFTPIFYMVVRNLAEGKNEGKPKETAAAAG